MKVPAAILLQKIDLGPLPILRINCDSFLYNSFISQIKIQKVISENTIILFVCPNAYAKFGEGTNKEYYGIFGSGLFIKEQIPLILIICSMAFS